MMMAVGGRRSEENEGKGGGRVIDAGRMLGVEVDRIFLDAVGNRRESNLDC